MSEITAEHYRHPLVVAALAAFPGSRITAVREKEPTEMVDLSPGKFEGFSRALEAHVDAAMEIANQEQEPRTYLGGSRLGEECARRLAYEYTHAPKDEGRHFKGKTLRIFDMGHDGETRVASYLRLAGFTLLTERANGKQFGFGIAKHPETGENRIAGHIDGVVTAGPESVMTNPVHGGKEFLAYPMLWENKALNDKGWKSCLSRGVQRAKPVYYAQMQVYMHHLDLHANPGLFTALNRETGELFAELVPFNPAAVQEAIDRGVRVISAAQPEDLPRVSDKRDCFACQWCDYQDRCWNVPATANVGASVPWMGGT